MKKSMSFAEQIRLLKVVSGIAWIVVGVAGCFENVVCMIIQMLALLVCVVNIVRVFAAKKENSDEMADENLRKAKAKTLDLMHGAFCVIAIAAMLILGRTTLSLDWSKAVPAAFFIILGVEELSVGIAFRKLEDE